MADPDRTPPHSLIDWGELAATLHRAGPFAVLRRLEAQARDLPRIGQSRRPSQNIVDLGQEPALGFAARTLTGLAPKYGRMQLNGTWLGLLGPMGPLPTHMTEAVYHERQFVKSHPLGDWLDLVAGRMLQLFFRAWAESQPAAQADRPEDDQFSRWLGALSGAVEGTHGDNTFFGQARVHYAAVFSGSRSAVALQDGLSHLLGQQVRVLEYMPKWRQLEPEDRSRLGRSFATLGSDAVLGQRVYSAADAFRVVVRAQNLDDYQTLLPEGPRFAVAAEAIEAFKPTHLEWDLCVELADAEAPAVQLGGRGRLGWSTWLKRPPATTPLSSPRRRKVPIAADQRIRADAHLRKTSLAKRKPAA